MGSETKIISEGLEGGLKQKPIMGEGGGSKTKITNSQGGRGSKNCPVTPAHTLLHICSSPKSKLSGHVRMIRPARTNELQLCSLLGNYVKYHKLHTSIFFLGRTGWTMQQNRLFNKVMKALQGDRLAKLTYEGVCILFIRALSVKS